MRALVDIPEEQVVALARIASAERVSRAALIRWAIADLIAARAPALDGDEAFGL